MVMTRKEVMSVLGPVDDATIVEIVSSGASLDELREAWAWTHGDEALMGEGRALPGTKVGQLIDLLQPQDEDPAGPSRSAPGGSATEW